LTLALLWIATNLLNITINITGAICAAAVGARVDDDVFSTFVLTNAIIAGVIKGVLFDIPLMFTRDATLGRSTLVVLLAFTAMLVWMFVAPVLLVSIVVSERVAKTGMCPTRIPCQ
jgi:hypothetical protein